MMSLTFGKPKFWVHEDDSYHCDQCNYQATQEDNLSIHKLNILGGVWYVCDQCGYQENYNGDLIKHNCSVVKREESVMDPQIIS